MNDQSARILILDDEDEIRSLLSLVIRRMGHEPVLTSSGDQAIAQWDAAAVSSAPYDLLMLDVRVPGGIGGHEVLAHVRKTHPDTRVVLISGAAPEDEPGQADEAPAAWLSKPFALATLTQTIEAMLDG